MAWLAGAAALLAGCANNAYLDAKRNTAAGGAQSQQIQAAKTDLQTAQTQNMRLASDKARREDELARNNQRIRALETDLRKQDATLASALKSKQVTQARYNELKREMDAVRTETQSVDLQNRGDAMSTGDAKADAAKEARLKDLERRKQDLEKALAGLAQR